MQESFDEMMLHDTSNAQPATFWENPRIIAKGPAVLTDGSISIGTFVLHFSGIKSLSMLRTTMSVNSYTKNIIVIDMEDGKQYLLRGPSTFWPTNAQREKKIAHPLITCFEAFKKRWVQEKSDEEKRQVIFAQEKQLHRSQETLDKLKKLVRVSKSLKISQMATILGMNEKELYDKIIDWADQFGFIIDLDVVDFSGGKKDDFITQLDHAFGNWAEKETNKDGKV